MERVGVYIDGLNLYYALKRLGWKRYYWLDVVALGKGLLRSNQVLAQTKYFTARLPGPGEKKRRQSKYLQALQTRPGLEIFYGRFKNEDVTCERCRHVAWSPKEKMTDVNIAVEIMRDVFQNRWDKLILVYADADLVPPMRAVSTLYPEKVLMVALPPNCECKELWDVSAIRLKLGEKRLQDSQLPDELPDNDGYPIRRPESWR